MYAAQGWSTISTQYSVMVEILTLSVVDISPWRTAQVRKDALPSESAELWSRR